MSRARDFISFLEYHHKIHPDNNDSDAKRELEEYVAMLPHADVPHCLTHALYLGSKRAVSAILDLRSLVNLSFQTYQGQRVLNGEALLFLHRPFLLAKNTADIKYLMELAPIIGLGFLTAVENEQGVIFEELTHYDHNREVHNPDKTPFFKGDLPRIDSNGVLHNPELVNAFHTEQQASSYPYAYSEVLCWVPKDSIDHLQIEIEPFEPMQEISATVLVEKDSPDAKSLHRFFLPQDQEALDDIVSNRAGKPWSDLRLSVISNIVKRGAEERMTNQDMGNPFSLPRSQLAERELPDWQHKANILTMTTPRQRYGLDFLEDHYLCAVKVDQVVKLEQGHQCAKNHEVANIFTSSLYSPLLRSAMAHKEKVNAHIDLKLDIDLGFCNQGPDVINLIREESPLKDWILSSVPAPVMHDHFDLWMPIYHSFKELPGGIRSNIISRSFSSRIDERELHAGKIYETLAESTGLNNKGRELSFSIGDLKYLIEKGIKMTDGTGLLVADRKCSSPFNPHGVENQLSWIKIPKLRDPRHLTKYLIGDLLDFGVFPSPMKMKKDGEWIIDKMPESIEDAVKQAARYKDILTNEDPKPEALVVILRKSGVEACAQVAKTPAQWVVLKDVFQSEILPYAGKAPAKVKRSLLSDDLGL